MAELTSWKINGKNSRVVDEWSRPVTSAGYSYRKGPNLSLSFNKHIDYDDETNKERNYNLRLDADDIDRMLKTIFQDTSNSLMSDLFGQRKHDRHFEPMLNKLGIYLNTYRLPYEGLSASDKYLYVRAVNERHAIEQLQRLFTKFKFDVSQIELVEESNG